MSEYLINETRDEVQQAPVDPGKKFDANKAPIFQGLVQYFPKALQEVAKISAYGARKYNLEYSDVNWGRVRGGFQRYSDALGRHFLGEIIDGAVDPESQEYHAAMVAWNALARLELFLREVKKD